MSRFETAAILDFLIFFQNYSKAPKLPKRNENLKKKNKKQKSNLKM